MFTNFPWTITETCKNMKQEYLFYMLQFNMLSSLSFDQLINDNQGGIPFCLSVHTTGQNPPTIAQTKSSLTTEKMAEFTEGVQLASYIASQAIKIETT